MKTLLMTSIAACGLMASSCAEAGTISNADKTEIEEIIRSYLLENPEILREVSQALREKELAAEAELNKLSLVAAKDALFNDPRDVSIGPKDAKVTIVEFFDYNCGFCKRATPWVEETIEKYGDDVRVVFKELPILDDRSKTSRPAAKAALAAARQGKYSAMHFALMEKPRITSDSIRETAEDIGLDMRKFDADLADPSIETHIDDTLALANNIPALTGTPFFVINDDYVSGADTNRLQALLDSALEG